MFIRSLRKNLASVGCLLTLLGCGHHSGKVPIAAATASAQPPTLMVASSSTGSAVHTFQSTPPAIQFEYPADWVPDKAQTACFAVAAPKPAPYSALSLDIPAIPKLMVKMLSINRVCDGYISDLKKNQIHDAVVEEKVPVKVGGCDGERITCCGHENGQSSIDVAIILIHSDQVFILSADSDQAGCDTAKKALDAAVASLTWAK